MKLTSRTAIFLAFLWMSGVATAQWSPEWTTQNYPASTDRVFAATLQSIQAQGHEIKAIDRASHTVDFHVGMTAWSWGYDMRLTVTPITVGEVHESHVTVGVTRSGGDPLSWDSGQKEMQKILIGIETALAPPQVGCV